MTAKDLLFVAVVSCGVGTVTGVIGGTLFHAVKGVLGV